VIVKDHERKVECPFCETVFDSSPFYGECPKCGSHFTWEEYCDDEGCHESIDWEKGKVDMQDSIPPLDNNSIMAGFDPIESEGDINPIGVIRSKPFMQSNDSQDYEGQEGHKKQ
jgi:hypothetical protein